MRIELERQESGWLVRVGDRWEDGLCTDEALGVVASMMYRGDAPYLKTELEHALWNLRYRVGPPLITETSSAGAQP